jgi:OmpA-OmpF porin, OOP family
MRVTAKGYGLTKPIATNKTVAGRAQNRRTEVTILQ